MKKQYTTANGNPCEAEPGSKVEYGVPEKYRPKLLEAFGSGGWEEQNDATYLMDVYIHRECPSRRWLDHEGTTVIDGEVVFVSEPYPYCRGEDDFSELERFLEKIDCELVVDTKSYWYPGKTIRLVFKPKWND